MLKGVNGIWWYVGIGIFFGFQDSYGVHDRQIVWDDPLLLVYAKKRFSEGIFDINGKCLLTESDIRKSFFAWDLNDVLLKPISFKALMYKFLKFVWSRGFLYTVIVFSDYYRAFHMAKQLKLSARASDKNALLLHRAYRIVARDVFPNNQQAAEDVVSRLEWLYPEMYHLDHAVATIVQGLEKQGIKNVVCTNMGDSWLSKQIQLFEEDKHETRSFQEIKDYQWAIRFLKQEKNFTPSVANYWIGKPDSKAYQQLLENNPGPYRLRIFVDDQPINVEAAVRNGFDLGILFKDSESFQKTLKKLGFLFV